MTATSEARPTAGAAVDREFAPAKVNLALHVRGRRSDQYHALDTIAVFAGVGDALAGRPSAGLGLALGGPFGPALAVAPGRNLILKAAEALAAEAAAPWPVAFALDKQIPLGAGLGGGSADAAAALRLLMRLWRVELAPARLAALAMGLGADVPMCLASRPVRARGAGEELTPVTMPPLDLVLVHPAVSTSTGAVFSRLNSPYDPPLPPLPARLGGAVDLVGWLRRTTNGLFGAALLEAPPIGDAIRALEAAADCLLARMTGSGSACYGLYPDAASAGAAAAAIAAARPDWWVAATVTGGS